MNKLGFIIFRWQDLEHFGIFIFKTLLRNNFRFNKHFKCNHSNIFNNEYCVFNCIIINNNKQKPIP